MQVFRVTTLPGDFKLEHFQSISCQPEYMHMSPEVHIHNFETTYGWNPFIAFFLSFSYRSCVYPPQATPSTTNRTRALPTPLPFLGLPIHALALRLPCRIRRPPTNSSNLYLPTHSTSTTVTRCVCVVSIIAPSEPSCSHFTCCDCRVCLQEIRWAYLHTKQDLPSAALFKFKPSSTIEATEPAEDSLWRANLYAISGTVDSTRDGPTTRQFWKM